MNDHLDALQRRRKHEARNLDRAKSEAERSLRAVWLAQIDKEIAGEIAFLAARADVTHEVEMTDDELLAALMA